MEPSQQIESLKSRILHKKGAERTYLTDLMDLAREFGCLGEIIGRRYEVFDANGKLAFIIEQKPMALKQVNAVMKELSNLKKMDAEIEAKKFGGKKGDRLGKRR